MKRKTTFVFVVTVLTVVFSVSAFNVIKIFYGYRQSEKTYEDLQSQYVEIVSEVGTDSVPENSQNTAKSQDISVKVDFNALQKRNPDIVGWLYCPETSINYPVVKSTDNNRYLKRDIDGKYLVCGTLFADYRNGDIGAEGNYIIYGHNMKNGSMFADLIKYKNQSFYDSHPVIYFLTPQGKYTIELYAGAEVDEDSNVYSFENGDGDFSKSLTDLKNRSTFRSNVTPAESDFLITLSTCSYEYDGARYVVAGKAVQSE